MTRVRLNSYVCDTCHLQIITLESTEGVTPFMLLCRATPGCQGMMRSCCYRVPVFRWLKMDPEKVAPINREHVRQGGLILEEPAAQKGYRNWIEVGDGFPNPLQINFGEGRIAVEQFTDKDGGFGLILSDSGQAHTVGIGTGSLPEKDYRPQPGEIYLKFSNPNSALVVIRQLMDAAGLRSVRLDQVPEEPSASPYGFCPICGAPAISRERRIDGNDICANHHTYPSAKAVKIERKDRL